jgi:hypothetical protein
MSRCTFPRTAALIAALYAVFLVTVPFEHHDLACHLKTPLHCTSCASSPLSVGSHAPFTPDSSRLADAGRAIACHFLSESALLAPASSGRSPPVLV